MKVPVFVVGIWHNLWSLPNRIFQMSLLSWSWSEQLYWVVYFSSNIPLDPPGLVVVICSLYWNINIISSVYRSLFHLSSLTYQLDQNPFHKDPSNGEHDQTEAEVQIQALRCWKEITKKLLVVNISLSKVNVIARQHSNINPMYSARNGKIQAIFAFVTPYTAIRLTLRLTNIVRLMAMMVPKSTTFTSSSFLNYKKNIHHS